MTLFDVLFFPDIHVGLSGRTHDARVLRKSPFYEKIEVEGAESLFPNHDLHILGDSAYPLHPWLMVPFKDHGRQSQMQRNYNYLHSKTRYV